MKEPYRAPPPPTGNAGEDRNALGAWLAAADKIASSDYAHTVPSRNGNTVALLRLGAMGPKGLLLGFELAGEYDPGTVLDLARERVRARLSFRRQFGSGVSLEDEFEVPLTGFSGCRTVDDYIGAIVATHASPASSRFVSRLSLSPGRPLPPSFDP